jgi:secondary thiamine-phosphate synthase enzyme
MVTEPFCFSTGGRRATIPASVDSTQEGAMKAHTEYFTFDTDRHREYINITDRVGRVVEESGVQEGMALVSAMHITAGVYVNDAESGLIRDIEEWLQQLAPEGPDYHHHRTGEANGDAHLKNLLIGHEIIVPITGGRMDLGPWQQIYYAEFDGQRPKRLIVKVMGE